VPLPVYVVPNLIRPVLEADPELAFAVFFFVVVLFDGFVAVFLGALLLGVGAELDGDTEEAVDDVDVGVALLSGGDALTAWSKLTAGDWSNTEMIPGVAAPAIKPTIAAITQCRPMVTDYLRCDVLITDLSLHAPRRLPGSAMNRR
jgi:hypothetical protein